MKAIWGVRALHACVISPPLDALELPRTSDYTIAVVSCELGSTGFEQPRPVLVVTELWELVFQLERPT